MSENFFSEITPWCFGAAINQGHHLLALFHSSSLTSTFNTKARSAWGPTLIFTIN